MKLIELCNLLEIPPEVQTKVLENESMIDFGSMEQELEQMKHPESWEVALETFKKSLDPDEDGMKILTCQLLCVCEAYAKYEEQGISKDIFIATMKFFTRFLQDYKNRHGSYRYDLGWWAVRQISMVEFRIGELEYEMRVKDNRHVIDLHIPADADMTISKLRSSYLEALEFFKQYYPDFAGVDMVCSSWLLAPSLSEVLPEHSRILQFQSNFTIERMEEDSLEFLQWVYGSKDIPIDQLPEDTTLQRNLKPFLQNKGKIPWTSGTLIAEPFLT